MTDALPFPAVHSTITQSPSSIAKLDTTASSAVHRFFGPLGGAVPQGSFPVLKLYMSALGITFLPLFVAALISTVPIDHPTEGHPLPFLFDWNVLFMFLVSFPCLTILIVTDQLVLSRSLENVQTEGTI